jgi:hypothetical protein
MRYPAKNGIFLNKEPLYPQKNAQFTLICSGESPYLRYGHLTDSERGERKAQ